MKKRPYDNSEDYYNQPVTPKKAKTEHGKMGSIGTTTNFVPDGQELKTGDFVHTFGDTHIYKNHVNAMKEQLQRKPRPFPKLNIKRKIEQIEDFKWDDFEIMGYDPHPKIVMDMAV